MRFTPLLLLFLLVSCNNKSTTTVNNAATVSAGLPLVDTDAFIYLFPVVDIDTVQLTTDMDSTGQYSAFIWGNPIDIKYAPLLHSFEVTQGGYSFVDLNEDSTYAYALGRFNLGRYTGLLIRHPGMYSSTCISLLLYNNTEHRFYTSGYWLAESWGDGGDYLAFDTGLKRINDSTITVTIDKVENGPDETDTTGYRYFNVDSTLTYQLVNTTLTLKSAIENKQWTDEPMRDEAEQNNE